MLFNLKTQGKGYGNTFYSTDDKKPGAKAKVKQSKAHKVRDGFSAEGRIFLSELGTRGNGVI